MPIYQYECRNCGEVIEALQKWQEPPLTHCDHCHQETLEQRIASSGFRFKGKGYYETDEKPKEQQRYLHDSVSKEA
jgi:putative FmdB family regulatory protein